MHDPFRKLLLLTLASLVCFSALGQGTLNANPQKLSWFTLQSPHFRIIFPQDQDSIAQYTANLLETIYEPGANTMGVTPKPISVILQNQTTVSNGFVSFAPRRSEFFIAPPQDYNFMGANTWLPFLAIHEYRHMVQFQRAYTGLNRLNYWLAGELGFGGFSFLVMPSWFWEGDAVGIETAFTPSGRGRIPEFNMAFRTTLLSRGPWNYPKQYLRSYKHFVPNHYVTGYYMTSYVRKKTGDPHIWDKVMQRAYRFPYLPFRLGYALKKETGTNLNDTYEEMVAEMQQRWEKQQEGLQITGVEVLNPRKEKREVYTNYRYPQELADGSVLTMRSGLGDIPQLVKLSPNRKPEVLFTPGMITSQGQLSQGGNVLAWIENEFDLRWTARDYSVIRLYNLEAGEYTRLTHKTRYLNVAVSPDGKRLAAISQDENSQQRLDILDAKSGQNMNTWSVAPGVQLAMPRFTDDGSEVVLLHTSAMGQKSLVSYQWSAKKLTTLIAPSAENIGHPVPWGKYVFYNSPYSGIDNIYALNTETGAQYQVTSRPYGAFNAMPSSDGSLLYFNDYTFYGYDAVSMPLNPESWVPKEQVKVAHDDTYSVWVEQEREHIPDVSSVPTEAYPVKPWFDFPEFFNIYSWGINVSGLSGNAEASISFQDELSTVQATATYGYNANENVGRFGANLSLQKFWPILDVSFEAGPRRITSLDRNNNRVTESFSEREIGAFVRVPLTLTRSKMLQSANVSVGVTNVQVSDFDSNVRRPVNQVGDFGQVTTFQYRADYSWQRRRSQRDLAPRWGVFTTFRYRHTPQDPGSSTDPNLIGWQGGNTTVVYLPGIGKHHTLQARGSFQQQFIPRDGNGFLPFNTYLFSSPFFSTLRGYSYFPTESMYIGSVSYGLPVLYPDWAFWHLLYIQRISMKGFFDYGYFQTRRGTEQVSFAQRAVGVDLELDLNGMRYLPQFKVGMRVGYALDRTEEPLFIGLLLNGVSLQNFNFAK